jgi:hypothetical protein
VQYACDRGGVLALHPLNQQCTAKAKATGLRCERRVVGGTVCWVHGGNAKQVKAKREQRILVAEAQAKARAAAPTVIVQREPEEILLDALHDTNQVLQQIKADIQGSYVNPILLQLAGDWFDRVARIGKAVTDGDLSERLHRRVGWLAEDRAAQLTALLASIVEHAPLSAQQRLAVWESRFDGLQAVADGRAPARMLGDSTTRFTDGLLEAAAVERAVAERITWAEPEPEPDSDSGGESGVPHLFAVPADGNGLHG